MKELMESGFLDVVAFMSQQIQQFKSQGEEFMIQHAGTDVMNDMEDDVRAFMEVFPLEDRLRGISPEERLAGLSAEERLAGLSAEERLEGLTPEERLQGLSPEDCLKGLSKDAIERLRKLIDRS
jgi:hypothetical protein